MQGTNDVTFRRPSAVGLVAIVGNQEAEDGVDPGIGGPDGSMRLWSATHAPVATSYADQSAKPTSPALTNAVCTGIAEFGFGNEEFGFGIVSA